MPSFVATDGVTIAYETEGPDGAEPLLLVAGQGNDRHMWDHVIGHFAASYRTIRWDHRGTGESAKPEAPPYSIAGFAADAIALADHLGVDRAHAYGISMGGRICQRLAIDWPDRVGAVVLGCTSPGNGHGVRRSAEVDAQMANRPSDIDGRIAWFASMLVSPEWAAANPGYMAELRARFADPIPRHAQRLHYAASEAHEAWDQLGQITAPVLVIHGDADQINVTANAPLLAGRIPGAELRLIAGGRHGFFVEFASEAGAAVTEFLGRHRLDPK